MLLLHGVLLTCDINESYHIHIVITMHVTFIWSRWHRSASFVPAAVTHHQRSGTPMI